MLYNNDKLIAAAFVKARAAIGGTVGKDAKGNFGRYATLAAITDAITEPLAKNGLAVIQEAELDETGVTVLTTLLHESGATMQFAPLTMPLTDRKPQAVGSAITYGRRYALAAVCGLAPDDDDGQAAQDATKPTQKPVDVSFDKPKAQLANATQIAAIGALGVQVYGDTWKDEQGHLAEWASQGARKALVDLYEMEAEKLIRGLQKKVAA
mgnify:CR=1 FL=1